MASTARIGSSRQILLDRPNRQQRTVSQKRNHPVGDVHCRHAHRAQKSAEQSRTFKTAHIAAHPAPALLDPSGAGSRGSAVAAVLGVLTDIFLLSRGCWVAEYDPVSHRPLS
jgi:hypothetical protein